MLPAPSKLEKYLSEYAFNCDYCLCLSDCDPRNLSAFLHPTALETLSHQPQGYINPKGLLSLREALSNQYVSLTSDHLRVTQGAAEAIWLVMHSLLSLGDAAIVQFPTYPSLYALPDYITKNTLRWPMDESKGWSLDLNYLDEQVTAKTRLIVLNSPNNPTGHLLSPSFLNEVVHIARKYGTYVLVDEVYGGLMLEDHFKETSIVDLYEKGIAIGSFSKAYGLAGIRVGWVATKDNDCLANMDLLKSYTSICGNAFSQEVALSALHQRDVILVDNLSQIKNNLDVLCDWSLTQDCPFEFIRPMAGPTVFAKMKSERSAKAYCRDKLLSTGVLLAHGDLFDMPDRYIRFGLGRRDFCDGLKRLAY